MQSTISHVKEMHIIFNYIKPSFLLNKSDFQEMLYLQHNIFPMIASIIRIFPYPDCVKQALIRLVGIVQYFK